MCVCIDVWDPSNEAGLMTQSDANSPEYSLRFVHVPQGEYQFKVMLIEKNEKSACATPT